MRSQQAARLGVVVDIQPAWLYLDTRTLAAHFGYDRLRYFQPLQEPVRGGRDRGRRLGPHAEDRLVAVDQSVQSVSGHVRGRSAGEPKGYEGQLHPEEALTREQAIRFYTINNARLMFLEDRIGSLEAGKQADFVVIDRDLLTCPEDEIKETRALATYVDGKRVFGSLISQDKSKAD